MARLVSEVPYEKTPSATVTVVQEKARSLAVLLWVLVVVIIAYWTLWYTHRSLIASESTRVYYGFEDAFPLADGLLALGMALTAWSLWTTRSTAVLFGLMSAGGGLYLFGMDVLFDAEHGIWARGTGGLVEALINVVTLSASALLARWIWVHRRHFDPTTST